MNAIIEDKIDEDKNDGEIDREYESRRSFYRKGEEQPLDKKINMLQQKIIIFFIGALGYGMIEVAFRGYTHWTMVLTGGVVFSLLYRVQISMANRPLWIRCLVGTGIITLVEFAVGCVVNLWLGWDVWDYSMFRFQILGQVCLLFSFLWFLLCGPVFYVVRKMRQSWS